MFSSFFSSCVLTLSLLAVATPNQITARAQSTVTGCCDNALTASSTLGDLFTLLGLPSTSVIGVNCANFSLSAVLNGQCVGTSSCTTSNIFSCDENVPLLGNTLSLGCAAAT